MALNKTRLRNAIKTKVEAVTGNPMPAVTLSIWGEIAEAIVEEITGNATVNVTTTCGSGAGTGTGTVT